MTRNLSLGPRAGKSLAASEACKSDPNAIPSPWLPSSWGLMLC